MGPLPAVADLSIGQVMETVGRDKKVIAGRLHFVLPGAIGSCEVVNDVTQDEIPRRSRSSACSDSSLDAMFLQLAEEHLVADLQQLRGPAFVAARPPAASSSIFIRSAYERDAADRFCQRARTDRSAPRAHGAFS